MQFSERGSGLLIAEQAAAPREIREALKRVDSSLILGQEIDARHQCYVWKVLARQGDYPARWLFDWRENMDDPSSRPRPLSSQIVDEAASRRLDSRRPHIDPLTANDERLAKLEEEDEQIHEDLAREALKRAGRSAMLPRSQSLRMSRDRQRRRGEKA